MSRGVSALQNAITGADLDKVRVWITENKDTGLVNNTECKGNIPLHIAVNCLVYKANNIAEYQVRNDDEIISKCKDEMEIVQELCKVSDLLDENNEGHLPCHMLLSEIPKYWDNTEVLKVFDLFLTKENIKIVESKWYESEDLPLLHRAIAEYQWEFTRLLLNKGVDINCVNYLGSTPLHFAADVPNIPDDIFNNLIIKETLNAQNDFLDTPILVACSRGKLSRARILLCKNADVNIMCDEPYSTCIEKYCFNYWNSVDMEFLEELTDKSHCFFILKSVVHLLTMHVEKCEMGEKLAPILQCLLFYLKPMKLTLVSFYPAAEEEDGVCYEIKYEEYNSLEGKTQSFAILHCISFLVCHFVLLIDSTTDSLSELECKMNQSDRRQDDISLIDNMWMNLKPEYPLSLQTLCGHVITDSVGSRMDMDSLGLPKRLLAKVMKSDLAETLWKMVNEKL